MYESASNLDLMLQFENSPNAKSVEELLGIAYRIGVTGVTATRREISSSPNADNAIGLREQKIAAGIALLTRSDFEKHARLMNASTRWMGRVWQAGVKLESQHGRVEGIPTQLNLENMVPNIRAAEAGEGYPRGVGATAWNIFSAFINERLGTEDEPIIVLPWNNSIHPSLRDPGPAQDSAIQELEATYVELERAFELEKNQFKLF